MRKIEEDNRPQMIKVNTIIIYFWSDISIPILSIWATERTKAVLTQYVLSLFVKVPKNFWKHFQYFPKSGKTNKNLNIK